MYSLHLSAEQSEIRDTVRDFVTAVIKPVVLNADRLDAGDRTLPMHLLDRASQLGLRTLALAEEHGGSGADWLTACMVVEELAAGDADIAAVLGETSRLAHILFDQAMTEAQCEAFLPGFLADDRCHLAFAGHEPDEDTRLGVNYHRPVAIGRTLRTVARASGDSLVVNGVKGCVANAPLAKLFAVEVGTPDGPRVVLVPAPTPGLTVRANANAWHHGPCGTLELADCRVPLQNLLPDHAGALLAPEPFGRGSPLSQAINLGIGRAAYEAALDYTRLRVQGGRPIVEHQAIAEKLANMAIRLDVARSAVWRAAWAADHPQAYADRSLPHLPLQTIAQVFTAEAIVTVCKDAAECFGAMGVMRDMPLQKYLHDARVCLHGGDGATEARLRIAEALVGFRHPPIDAVAAE